MDEETINREWIIGKDNPVIDSNPYYIYHAVCNQKTWYKQKDSHVCWYCEIPIPEKYIKLKDMLNFMSKL